MKNKAKKLKLIKFLSIFMCFMLTFFAFSGCTRQSDYSDIKSEEYTPKDVNMFVDDLGYNAIKVDGDIKVLQLSDLHIGNGYLCVKRDRKAIEAICRLIESSNPDLIVLTGDVVYPFSLATGTNDNLSALKVVAEVIELYKIPWTMCFGNHDAESVAKYSKSELCDYLESDKLEYCLFERGDSMLEGMGNHIINVYNSDNTFNTSIVLFDNGDYLGGYQLSGYAPVSQAQTDWYTSSITDISDSIGETVQSFIFYHVPGREYYNAWQSYRSDGDDVVYHFGWANEDKEKISCPDENGPLFDAIIALNSTKGIFAGHNHLNDYSVSYNGIRLTCGKAIDYIAYPGIATKTEQRGATILTLKGTDSSMTDSFTIHSIILTEIE